MPDKVTLNIPSYIYSIKIMLAFSGKQIKIKHQVTTILSQLYLKMYLTPIMTNTNNILLMAAITSLLIMGTSMIPMQSYADSGSNDENKNYDDSKSKTGATSQTDKKSANQHMGQDNFCYRGNETCTQANEGQQLVGEDNEAAGFNDQSDNLALSSSSHWNRNITNTNTNTNTNNTKDL